LSTLNNILDEVTEYYLHTSRDFNGLPSYNINNYDETMLKELITEEKILIITEFEDINPHIKRFDYKIPIQTQIEYVSKRVNFVAYPTSKYLKSLPIFEERPFTKMLCMGEPQLKFLYFNADVLSTYFNNPQYMISDHGYGGSISIKDTFYKEDDPINSEYIQNYGLATRKKAERKERYVGLILRDLNKLNVEGQSKFRGFLLPNQNEYIIEENCYTNLIQGNFVMDFWIFDVLLKEIEYINQMSKNMGLPPLFNNTISTRSLWTETPDYRNILVPTLKNYYRFVTALEKITVQSINVKFFQTKVVGFITIPKENGQTNPHTLKIFEDWLDKNKEVFSSDDLFKDKIITPLRDLRKERQKPAHKEIEDKYDIDLFTQQDELIRNIFTAIREIRKFFSQHPNNKEIKIPAYFNDDKRIRNY